LLSGEPGIGKSRLTAAVLECVAAGPHTRLRYFCSPQHTDSALYPIISQMERAAGFSHDDTAKAKLDKLDTLLAQSSTPSKDAALFAEMLSLPNDGRHPSLQSPPEQRRLKTLDALIAQMEALSRSAPVLMIFEDVHWIDPTSLEALGRTVERLRSLRTLLIVTYRPEFEPSWIGRPYVAALSLNRLGEREIVALIDRVTGNKSLPESIRQDIIERTDGIPLFVEEMTKAVLEAGEGDAQRTAGAVPSPALAVPASLHASLMARLDRLGNAKEVAQIGATIGREFSHALLAAVARKPEVEVRLDLDRLTTAGLLYRQGEPPNATYLFKHALVQEAAYGTLLRDPRRSLHARVAQTIEDQFTDIAEVQPEVLARHFTEAKLLEQAASWWGKAGRRSLERSALVEATAQFTRALDHIASLSATPALRREQIKLQIDLANTLMHVKGYAASETSAAFGQARMFIERAEALGEPPEDPLLLFSVLFGIWGVNRIAFNGDAMRQLSAQFLALAAKQKATVPLMNGHRAVGISLLLTGDISEGRAHLDRAIALYKPVEHGPVATRFGTDVGVSILSYRSIALWLLGYPEAALADTDRALIVARGLGQAASLMFALHHASLTHIQIGNIAAARAHADELFLLANDKDASLWRAFAILMRGCLLTLNGDNLDAIETITQGIAALRSTGAASFVPLYLPLLATAYSRLNRFDEAWRVIGEAMTAVETTKERWCEAEVIRTAGKIALMSPEPNLTKAKTYFEHALSVARQQQAKSWELRAAMSLGRLWRAQGKVREARELLAPVYEWFTEGFNTRDLKEAKALLEELSAQRQRHDYLGNEGLMSFCQNSVTITVVIAASLLACASAIAKPFPPREGCRPVSRIEYNAAKREYLLRSRARVYIRTGRFWRRQYWHCPI
jgi:predicted ATPase